MQNSQQRSIREGTVDKHAFALVFGDSSVQPLPLSAGIRGPLHFWKYNEAEGAQHSA